MSGTSSFLNLSGKMSTRFLRRSLIFSDSLVSVKKSSSSRVFSGNIETSFKMTFNN